MEPCDIARLLTEDVRVNNGLLFERDSSVAAVEPEVPKEASPEEVEKARAVELKQVDPVDVFKKVAQDFVVGVFKSFPDPGKAYQVARSKLGLKFSGTKGRKIILKGGSGVVAEFDPFDKGSVFKAAKEISRIYKAGSLSPEVKQNRRDVFVKQFDDALGQDVGAAKDLGVSVKQVSTDEFEVNLPINYEWDEGEQAADDVKSLVRIIKPGSEVERAKRDSWAQRNRAAAAGAYQVGL